MERFLFTLSFLLSRGHAKNKEFSSLLTLNIDTTISVDRARSLYGERDGDSCKLVSSIIIV